VISITERLAYQNNPAATLIEGEKAMIKHTGQLVDLKRVSEHGISVVSFRPGGDYLISNIFLEPVIVFH